MKLHNTIHEFSLCINLLQQICYIYEQYHINSMLVVNLAADYFVAAEEMATFTCKNENKFEAKFNPLG